MTIVTLEEMTEAVLRTLVAHGKIPREMAEKVALQVLSYFGSEEAIVDNVLATKDRDVFYWLEEEGLLSSEEEMAVVGDSRNWRIHYWLLNIAAIHSTGRKKERKEGGAAALYQQLPPEEWARGGGEKGPERPNP